LTMESSHKQDILKNFRGIKNLEEKVFTLKEFNGEKDDIDIVDPYYTLHPTYIKILKVIDENVEAVIKKLKIINRNINS
jgi:protein-tyrosine-phosphatase